MLVGCFILEAGAPGGPDPIRKPAYSGFQFQQLREVMLKGSLLDTFPGNAAQDVNEILGTR